MGEVGNRARANVDLTSGERYRSPETQYRTKVWDNNNWTKSLVIKIVTIPRTQLSLIVVMKITTESVLNCEMFHGSKSIPIFFH